MGRPRCLTLLCHLLLLVPSVFFLSPAAAITLRHSEVFEKRVLALGGRRSQLQAEPPVPPSSNKPPPATAEPPPSSTKPPTSSKNPPPSTATPPTSKGTPGPPPVTAAPPQATANPPGNSLSPATATSPVAAGTPGASPAAVIPPSPASMIAPAPGPSGITPQQNLNAIIAGSVIGSVILIGASCLFCRCQCLKRQKKMPFQRLQMM